MILEKGAIPDGDFGFYSADDKFYESENVTIWMPMP